MSTKQKMCTVMDLPTSILASSFAPLMLARIPNHFRLLTMVKHSEAISDEIITAMSRACAASIFLFELFKNNLESISCPCYVWCIWFVWFLWSKMRSHGSHCFFRFMLVTQSSISMVPMVSMPGVVLCHLFKK